MTALCPARMAARIQALETALEPFAKLAQAHGKGAAQSASDELWGVPAQACRWADHVLYARTLYDPGESP